MPRPHSWPGSTDVTEAFHAIKMLFKNNPNQGAGTENLVTGQSCFTAQERENEQRTPPIPSQSPEPNAGNKKDASDMATRYRQLRTQLFDAGKADLFYPLTRSQDSTQPKTTVLNIATLQRMSLSSLQYEISCMAGAMHGTRNSTLDSRAGLRFRS